MVIKTVILLLLLPMLAACRAEPATGSSGTAATLETAVTCPEAAADQQSLTIPEHGYCLLLPAEYALEQPSDIESIFFVGSLLDVAHPKLFITVEDAGEVYTQAEALYDLVTESFRFLPSYKTTLCTWFRIKTSVRKRAGTVG